MAEHSMELSGMSCGACERIIKKVAEKDGIIVKSVDGNSGKVVVDCDAGKLPGFKEKLNERGFFEKGAGARGDFSRFVKFCSKVVSGDETAGAESALLNYALGSAVFLALLSAIFYFVFVSGLQNAILYAPLLGFAVLAAVSIVGSYFHCSGYRASLSCQNGMMVGMTSGMVAGLLSGALIGATNGMFIGSVAGMFFGILVGFLLGKNSGVMGALEGLMAGVMSGTMGAMISVMMVTDNLLLFLFIFFPLCIAISSGLVYMLYREQGACPMEMLEVDFWQFSAHAFWVFAVLVLIMFFGPKSGIGFP